MKPSLYLAVAGRISLLLGSNKAYLHHTEQNKGCQRLDVRPSTLGEKEKALTMQGLYVHPYCFVKITGPFAVMARVCSN